MSSWYFDLAAGEELDPKQTVSSLVRAIIDSLTDGAEALHMGKPLGLLEEPLLKVKEVAVILNVSEESVRRYARDKVLTTVDIPGGAIRFHRKTLNDELNRFVRASKHVE
jgi:excisionase family DNA binding protein